MKKKLLGKIVRNSCLIRKICCPRENVRVYPKNFQSKREGVRGKEWSVKALRVGSL
jgi:hypothetical protein